MRIRITRFFLLALNLCITASTFAEDALDHWYQRDARAVNQVKFLGGLFVGVGNNGRILTSPDGQTWTARNSGTTANLTGIAFGGAFPNPLIYVAVGASATILTSSNAINWTSVVTTNTCNLNDVTFGGVNFVAVTTKETANQPNALVSQNGTSWTPKIFSSAYFQPFSPITHDIVWVGNNFITASGGGLGDEVWTSSGGGTWQSRGLVSLAVRGFAFGNDRVVGFGFENSPIVSTNLGASWFRSTSTIGCPTNESCPQGYDIAFGNSTFVGLKWSYGSDGIVTTIDGLNWSYKVALKGKELYNVTFGNGTFIASGPDGIHQSEPVSTPFLAASRNSQSNALNIVVSGEVGRAYRLQTSTNLANWFDHLSYTNNSPTMEFAVPITNAVQLYFRAATP